MNEIGTPSPPPRQTTASPPPKCAICLGTCSNKCFSDSCRHQFCFTCLLEWSKVKAECPLCKQPFKSIIYNIKSNDEYDEHIINNEPIPGNRSFLDNENYFYIPPAPSRHFQFRTTFTVDSGGELAIQQMLLSHPLTNSLYNIGDTLLPRQSRFGRLRHTRRASSATSFRRSIYMTNMWVYAPPDMTGRYREVTPHFYRENPASRNRLVPWLNRELNALLSENTQQVMHLVDVIMQHLTRWHIRSRSFKRLLENYLTNKTDHFIHEFYNFMRSPYDMIGYDRQVIYSDRPHSPTYLISDPEDDSDVAIVNISEPITVNNNPFRRPTIEVIEINSDSSHDSDVIIGETPVPEVVLIDSDSNEDSRTPELQNSNRVSEDSDNSEVNRKPILPLKIRLKRKRQSRERRSRNKKRSYKRHRSSSLSFTSSSSDESSDSTSSSNDSTPRRTKRKHRYKKSKGRSYKDHKDSKSRSKDKHKKIFRVVGTESSTSSSSSSDSDTTSSKSLNVTYDSDDSIPLSQIKRKELKKQKVKKPQAETLKSCTLTSKSSTQDSPSEDHSKPSCSQWSLPKSETSAFDKINVLPSTSSTSASPTKVFPSTSNSEEHSYPNSDLYYPNTIKNPLLDFHPSRYDSYNQYPLFGSGSYISPASEPTLYYEGLDMNLTKPLDYYNNCENRDYHSDNKMLGLYSSYTPSRVNIGVGTSPVRDTEVMYGNCCPNGLSSSRRLQSVIVKKEDKDNPNAFPTVGNDSNTDSM